MSKQLKAILWKNWLLKVSHPWSTAAELFLPVIFMALLILIKQITSSYDSPNVSYSCGNAVNFFLSFVFFYLFILFYSFSILFYLFYFSFLGLMSVILMQLML